MNETTDRAAADASAPEKIYDVAIVGGGPSGATAAQVLAKRGWSVVLLDRDGRIKPCGGAIPPCLVEEFDIPDSLLVARISSARMISPASRRVDMPIDGGYVGMVDREHFDEWLRVRAMHAGAERRTGQYERLDRDGGAGVVVRYRTNDSARDADAHSGAKGAFRARVVIGADGANSLVAHQEVPGADRIRYVSAYHEIVRVPKGAKLPGLVPADAGANAPGAAPDYDATRCDVYYQGEVSPDFYGWIFPHGDTASIGVGTAHRGYSLRSATARLRKAAGLEGFETVRREGAPIPMEPLKRWDNGRDVVLAGDAAGVVAPASGEGIYYAMTGGRLAAEAVDAMLTTGDARALAGARRAFMKAHGRVFWVLGLLQKFWYSSDARRERFVKMCMDPDVQRLTWQSYMHKKLVRREPLAHVRVFFKDVGHLLGLART